ncbi:MAG: hypothetical protein IPQ00_18070, partial [Chloracidobacterium sp.]|nr:hypothetical protein [Chloracidobacterium sp.]
HQNAPVTDAVHYKAFFAALRLVLLMVIPIKRYEQSLYAFPSDEHQEEIIRQKLTPSHCEYKEVQVQRSGKTPDRSFGIAGREYVDQQADKCYKTGMSMADRWSIPSPKSARKFYLYPRPDLTGVRA